MIRANLYYVCLLLQTKRLEAVVTRLLGVEQRAASFDERAQLHTTAIDASNVVARLLFITCLSRYWL